MEANSKCTHFLLPSFIYRYLTAEEMTAIRAPLMRLEHCTKPFFTQCDANKDDMISLEEWGLCLGLTQGKTI